MRATDGMQTLKKDRIDLTYPEGIQLTNAIRERAQRDCLAITDQAGHRSVWKAINHADGRSVTDGSAAAVCQL